LFIIFFRNIDGAGQKAELSFFTKKLRRCFAAATFLAREAWSLILHPPKN
jgi:hypothetical protein